MIDDFACSKLKGKIEKLPEYFYSKVEKKVLKIDSQINSDKNNICITPFYFKIDRYPKVYPEKEDYFIGYKVNKNKFDLVIQKVNKSCENYYEDGSLNNYLIFKKQILNQKLWIPIKKKIDSFGSLLDISETYIKKSLDIENKFKESDLQTFVEDFLNLSFCFDSKVEFIKKLYKQLEKKENELILKQIETQFNHNNENLKKIYLINILISLTNLMDKRLKYLKRKNWELNDFTVKCTKQMMEDNFSDISEESFSEIIQRDFKKK